MLGCWRPQYWLRKEQCGLQHRHQNCWPPHQPQHTKHSSDDSENQVPLRPPFLSTFAPESASYLSTVLVYATPARQKQPRHSLAALLISVACYKVQERCSRPPCRVEPRPNNAAIGTSAAASFYTSRRGASTIAVLCSSSPAFLPLHCMHWRRR